MQLILCVDERDGLSFCGRRLSRDSRLVEHMLSLCEGHTLWVHPNSEKLFPAGTVQADEQFLTRAGKEDFCFVEIPSVDLSTQNWESVTLYNWNRAYPATEKFDRKLLTSLCLTHQEEFPGNSHETITMERYTL